MMKTIKIRIDMSDYTTNTEQIKIQNAIIASLKEYNQTTTNIVVVKEIWFARK